MDLKLFCNRTNDWYNEEIRNSNTNIVLSCMYPIWVVGILGNLVNLVVFRHEKMAHPINLIFWWLSISDLLELIVFTLQQYDCRWCTNEEIIELKISRDRIYEGVFTFTLNYLLQVLHTITVGLNITLIFRQYTVVAHPLMNRKNSFNIRSIKQAVIWMYISSFLLYLPLWFMYDLQYSSSSDNRRWKIQIRESTNRASGFISQDPLVDIGILFYGIVLHIGPLIILIILCALLLFAMKNQQRNRQSLGLETHHLSKAQKQMNRMSVTTVVVIIMFLITEVPIGISTFSLLFYDYLVGCWYSINSIILPPLILLNCSFSILCYLIRIKEYRKTLALLLSQSKNWFTSRARVLVQTDSELHPL